MSQSIQSLKVSSLRSTRYTFKLQKFSGVIFLVFNTPILAQQDVNGAHYMVQEHQFTLYFFPFAWFCVLNTDHQFHTRCVRI